MQKLFLGFLLVMTSKLMKLILSKDLCVVENPDDGEWQSILTISSFMFTKLPYEIKF